MDYEKLHKDTINRLQQMVSCGKITAETARGICADFVPESEDERIRKELITWLQNTEGQVLPMDRYNAALAWLEKQGEKNDAEKKEVKKIGNEEVNGDDYGIDGLWHAKTILEKTLGNVDGYQSDDGILDHKAAITAVKKLYEKKPTLEDTAKAFLQALSDTPYNNTPIVEAQIITKQLLTFLSDPKAYNPNAINEHKSAEWSEEDEQLIDEVAVCLRKYEEIVQGGYSKFYVQSLADRIESLRPGNTCKATGWSEEDSYMLEQAIKCVNNSGKLDVSTEEIEDWLKSLKQRHAVEAE